ncbi:hypothetical protein DL764_002159 [Monosporascus ibericus]|uniref:Uncharacterized protein n=1 Tax=Monosporascus ibericus TaxID=155417 RepID=A0A4Q4TRE2_9PEZI|nr:hypothetical protein DL764_002159 [Monosporascus ibericus]
MHAGLLQLYLSREGDMTQTSPMIGFAGFVSASILVILAKSQKKRWAANADRQAKHLVPLAGWVRDAIDVLDVLGVFWERLQTLAQDLRQAAQDTLVSHTERWTYSTTDRIPDMSMAEAGCVGSGMLTGANSPVADGETLITTEYVSVSSHIRSKEPRQRSVPGTPTFTQQLVGESSLPMPSVQGSSSMAERDVEWRRAPAISQGAHDGLTAAR